MSDLKKPNFKGEVCVNCLIGQKFVRSQVVAGGSSFCLDCFVRLVRDEARFMIKAEQLSWLGGEEKEDGNGEGPGSEK